MHEREWLEKAIAALEAQRAGLGPQATDFAIATLCEKIAALERGEEPSPRQRKQASVLFGDISGFTALSESMDAEDVSDLMNSLWLTIDQIIIKHGGWVDKHIGDAVMALWGVDTAQEDDPARAIRAALEIQEYLRQRTPAANDPDRQAAICLQMRIAVHTGPVLLGATGVTGEYTAIGDTVNTASRLQHHAPLGSVIISQATQQQVRGLFDVQALPPIPARGKTEPLQAYQVLRHTPRTFHMQTRGLEGITTRLIGREAELEHLRQSLQSVQSSQTLQVVTILGDAGVGKSRLLQELEAHITSLAQPPRLLRSRAFTDWMHRPYSLLRGLLAEHLHIQETDLLAEVWQKFENGLAGQGLAPEAAQMRAHFIGQLLGFDFSASPHLAAARADARQVHDRALLYLADFLRAAAQPSGCTIFLDDIHWADDSSLEMLAYLFRALADQPLLVLCLARPALLERRPAWGQGAGHSLLRLEPLSKEASQRLVSEILQVSEGLPPALQELILNNAEGNPYYIEELIKMLLEDGLLTRQEGQLEAAAGSLQAARIPQTLTGILQARMDSLPGEQRDVLQRSSVVGRTFWDETVSSLEAGQPLNLTDLEHSFDALQQRELILAHAQAVFSGTREFTFKHAILHDVTYESVLKRDRRRYHAHIAAWLIERCGQRAREYSGLIADHLEKAGQPQKALPYLRLAGEQARQTLANGEALGYFSRALAYEKDPAARFELLLGREELHDLQGQREAQQQDLAALETLAQALGPAQQARVALPQANYFMVTADYPASQSAAQRALALAQACQDAALQAAAYFALGQIAWRTRSYQESMQSLQQALPLAQASGQAEVEADTLRIMGNVMNDQGRYHEAAGYFDQSLAICQRINYRSSQSAVLNALGILHRAQGNIDASLRYYQQALALAQEVGDRRMESGILVNLGVLYRNQADYPRAIEHYEKALRIHQEIDEPQYQSATLINLAVCFQHQGKISQSIHTYQQALETKRRIRDQRGESTALTGLGTLWMNMGYYQQSFAHLTQAMEITQTIGHRRGEIYALNNLGNVAWLTSQYELAQQYNQKALALVQELNLPSEEAMVRLNIGQTLAAWGQYAEAAVYFVQVSEHYLSAEEPSRVAQTRAELALCRLAQDQLEPALALAEEVWEHVQTTRTPQDPAHGLIGTDDPAAILLACYQVFQAAGHPQAGPAIADARRVVLQRAALIDDEALRRSYLENVSTHRQILALSQV